MFPLTVHHLLWRMRNVHPHAQVVSVGGDAGGLQTSRCTYSELTTRIDALVVGLQEELGLHSGGTVAAMGWNDQTHLELILAVPAAGAKLSSLNIRAGTAVLSDLVADPLPDLLVVGAGVMNHPVIGHDAAAIVQELQERGVPILAVPEASGELPEQLAGAASYEALVQKHLGRQPADLPKDENSTAYIFHTSGTTGRPRSYDVTHRAALLHCLSQATTDASGISRQDTVLALAPFFHVNGWGLPMTCALTGATLVLIGSDVSAVRVASVMSEEKVTVAAAVPTVWHDVCAAVASGRAPRPQDVREILTGGSIVSSSDCLTIRTVLGASVTNTWGMTETMACSTYEREVPQDQAGRPIPLVELHIQDGGPPDSTQAGLAAPASVADGGDDAPPPGRLLVRGPFVIGAADISDGWRATGDIATIEDGVLTLRDREKDLIKSGGEWIVSAELELQLCSHHAVTAAAVVPLKHPRWGERPVAYVTLAGEADPAGDMVSELMTHLSRQFPRWWLPDNIIVVEKLPTTAVGKINKRALCKIANEEKERV